MRHRSLLIMVVAMLVTTLAGPAAASNPAQDGDYDIKIVGRAHLYPYGGVIDGTTVALDVRVKCPTTADRVFVPFAGMPDAFGGRFPEPYLPGHTGPGSYGGMVTCTGEWVKATTIARSVSRLQDPATHPYEYFSHERITFVVEIEGGTASHTKTVRVVVPSRTANPARPQ